MAQLEPYQPALLPQDGKRLRGGRLLHGHRHQDGVSDISFNPRVKVFRLHAMAIPLQATGGVDTQPTRTSHSYTRVFCRVAQDLSHRVRIHSVSQNSHSSHLAQHVARALVVVSFTLKHSSPTLFLSIW